MAVQYFLEDAGNANSFFSVSYVKKGFFAEHRMYLTKKNHLCTE